MSSPRWREPRFLIAGAVVFGIVAGSLVFLRMRPGAEDPASPDLVAPPIDDEKDVELREVELFFPGDDGRLHPMARELPVALEPTENIRRLVTALLAGPHGEFAVAEPETGATQPGATPAATSDAPGETSSGGPEAPAPAPRVTLADLNPADGLWPPFPADVALDRTYLLDDATVIVDLVSGDGKPPSAGSRAEALMLYSLVNTVLLNTAEAKRLLVLWNGQQPSTFTGHLDTTRPLGPKTELIAR